MLLTKSEYQLASKIPTSFLINKHLLILTRICYGMLINYDSLVTEFADDGDLEQKIRNNNKEDNFP